MADLKFIISALNKSSGELDRAKKQIDEIANAGKNGQQPVQTFGQKVGDLIGVAALAAGALYSVASAVKGAYEAAKEGADLDYASEKFERLAAAVGSTSDAMLGDLKEATGGIKSDSELVAGAADIMSLGLVKNYEDIIRLTKVAGGLDMNMQQLVLTLTNETTMRFDQLGVKVDGFKDKVKALEDAGMDTNAAFTEAFLRQAEEQLLIVGDKADTTAGKFLQLESATKNLGDAMKKGLAEKIAPVVPALTDAANNMTLFYTGTRLSYTNMSDLNNALADGMIEFKAYQEQVAILNALQDAGVKTTEAGAVATDEYAAALRNAGIEVSTSTDDFITRQKLLQASSEATAKAQALVAEETAKAQALVAEQAAATAKAFNDQKSAVTSLGKNFTGIIGLAKNFDKALEEIVKQEDIMAKNPIGSEKYVEAEKKIKSLKEEMSDLANQVVLDMFQATIAIGGITEAEADAYFQMADDMGVISKGAADAAINAYGNAISKINGMKIDPKTGNVKINVDDSEYRWWKPNDFTAYIKLKRDSVEIDKWLDSVHYTTVRMRMTNERMATGGQVASNTIYTVGEEGPELFVPASNGYIINHDEASRALAGAVNRGNSGIDPSALASAIASALAGVLGSRGGNVFNLTMPTSNNPADIKTAFELMEAWNA